MFGFVLEQTKTTVTCEQKKLENKILICGGISKVLLYYM